MRHIPVAIELGIRVVLGRDSTRVGKSAPSYFTSDSFSQICDISSIRSDGILHFGNSTVLQQLRVNLKAPGLRVSGETINSFINCAKERGNVEKLFKPANFSNFNRQHSLG